LSAGHAFVPPEGHLNMKSQLKIVAGTVLAWAVLALVARGPSLALAGDKGTKAEAVAMVKKAIGFIKANGNDKAFAEISNRSGQFVDRDLYVVYDLNAKCLAHGANPKMIGRELLDSKDVEAATSQEIRRTIVEVNQAARQSSAGAAQTRGAGETLAKLADELQTLIGQFRVGGNPATAA
jgi:hypothetical protein